MFSVVSPSNCITAFSRAAYQDSSDRVYSATVFRRSFVIPNEALMHSRVLDRDTAPNENFVLVLTNPYSGPRRAARQRETGQPAKAFTVVRTEGISRAKSLA